MSHWNGQQNKKKKSIRYEGKQTEYNLSFFERRKLSILSKISSAMFFSFAVLFAVIESLLSIFLRHLRQICFLNGDPLNSQRSRKIPLTKMPSRAPERKYFFYSSSSMWKTTFMDDSGFFFFFWRHSIAEWMCEARAKRNRQLYIFFFSHSYVVLVCTTYLLAWRHAYTLVDRQRWMKKVVEFLEAKHDQCSISDA